MSILTMVTMLNISCHGSDIIHECNPCYNNRLVVNTTSCSSMYYHLLPVQTEPVQVVLSMEYTNRASTGSFIHGVHKQPLHLAHLSKLVVINEIKVVNMNSYLPQHQSAIIYDDRREFLLASVSSDMTQPLHLPTAWSSEPVCLHLCLYAYACHLLSVCLCEKLLLLAMNANNYVYSDDS